MDDFSNLTVEFLQRYHTLKRLYLKIKEKLKRGHVHLIGSISNIDILQGSIEPSLNTIQNYMKAITVIKRV